jgi:hypothetical protein
MPTLAELYKSLRPDLWRNDHANAFTEEMEVANRVLNHPFANATQRREALEAWLQKHQPCIFGRIAAAKGSMHFCFLTVDDLLGGDDAVRVRIRDSKKLWKQRAIRGQARHGFILVFCDRKVAFANPDEHLYRFSLHLQELAGWVGVPHIRGNAIADEWLYLQHPRTKEIVKFVFSVDYFAAAGDRRWWHDHRVPGGVAFTANSLGHMAKQQEWYLDQADRIEWALRTAMNTIDTAAKKDSSEKPIPYGPATYLRKPAKGVPLKPFTWTKATKPVDSARLEEYDPGNYEGYLHTDHAVRLEFFNPDMAPAHKEEPYAMEFSYIFDPGNEDHRKFVVGVEATPEEVEAELGKVDDLQFAAAAGSGMKAVPPDPVSDQIEDALNKCREWKLKPEELEDLL